MYSRVIGPKEGSLWNVRLPWVSRDIVWGEGDTLWSCRNEVVLRVIEL